MLRLERDGAVAHLLIDRAAKRNAFTVAMWEQCVAMLGELAHDSSVRLLMLGSADPTIFCAGGDLEEFAAMIDDRGLRARSYRAMRSATATLAGFPHPTLAVIGGSAFGAGLALAVACDVRIAAMTARFSLPPARLGLVYPPADLERLRHLIGPAWLKRLIFTADNIDAKDAQAIGLIEQVAAPGDLDAAAEELAQRIIANSPDSLRMMKSWLQDTGQAPDADAAERIFLDCYDGADFREGLAAFRERRNPRFSAQD